MVEISNFRRSIGLNHIHNNFFWQFTKLKTISTDNTLFDLAHGCRWRPHVEHDNSLIELKLAFV